MKNNLLLVAFILVPIIFTQAQNKKIDSLTTLLKTEKIDTSKVNLLNQIAIENITIGNFDTVPYYANKAISIANKSAWKKGLAEANNMLRSAYFNKADYDEALKYANISLQLFKEINDENGVAGILSNIGGIYWNRGEYPRALENMLEALKIYEKNKNKKGIAKVNGNIGLVYFDQNEPEKSLKYFFKALQLDKELKNKNGISRHLSNIGNIYFQKYEFKTSLQYYFEALKINEELNNVNSKGINLGNIGNVYVEINQPDTALKYLFKAIEINRSTGNKGNIARDLSNIGTAYLKLKNYALAESYLKEALKITNEIESLDYVRRFELALSDVYLAKGDYKNAYAHFKLYSNAKDSIFNEEKHKDITKKEMNYEYEKKELAIKAENDKKAALAAETNKRQKIIIWSVVFGLVLVAVILILVFRSLQITKSQKQVIEKQKEEVVKQKEIIQEHQKEILDSITYAKRIQEAILPPQKLVKQYLEESFILYKPKDIVAGDFYWLEAKKDLVLFAAADCTGHGVPGAMVSVVCSNALNRTVKEFAITEPGKILDKVKELVLETFEKSEDEVKDGMDISLCALNLSTKTLHWSGANNPLWIIRNNELIEYSADKQPIGKTDFGKNFSTHQIELQKNDSIYIFTDGYADQFGGNKGKKFKSANFKKLLLSIVNEPMTEQRNKINKEFENWRGELEQVDDVCVIGVRV